MKCEFLNTVPTLDVSELMNVIPEFETVELKNSIFELTKLNSGKLPVQFANTQFVKVKLAPVIS